MIEKLEDRRLNSATAIDLDPATTDPAPEQAVTVATSNTVTSTSKRMAEMLSNVSKARSEISMTYARNARA